jgi:GxxExxY protein
MSTDLNHKDTKDTKDARERSDHLSNEIIGAAIEVHRALGPGLLESVYEECLARELTLRGLHIRRQVAVPLEYKGGRLECTYRLDLVVEDLVVVEIKAVDRLEPVHEAQVLTYLRLTGRWLGLPINFNTPLLKNGIRRLVNG